MNKLSLTLTAILLSLALTCPAQAYKKRNAQPPAPAPAAEPAAAPAPAAPSEQAAQPASPMMDEAMMAKWKEYATPNENHAVLNYFVGNWDYTMKWWMAPETTPEETTGTSTSAWLLGGRFIEQKVAGTSMGQPFEGLAIMGYDNVKKQYKSIWLDNMGTGVMTTSPSYDATAKTFSETGSHSCPLTESGEKTFRAMTTLKDDDHYTYEFYTTTPDGKEFKGMEITYTRKK